MNSVEENYYENPEFWDGSLFTDDDDLRFAFVAKHVPQGSQSLADVGCGNGMFLAYLAEKRADLKLHGVDRSKAALEHVRVEKTRASIDSVPLPSRSFSTVTCLEVIEHLPEAIYRSALSEIARIADRHVLISVPLDQDLTIGRTQCDSCKTLFNPDYHFRSYTMADMPSLLQDHGFEMTFSTAYGDVEEFAGSYWITRVKNDVGNRFPVEILCPACGHAIPGRGGVGDSSQGVNRESLLGTVKAYIKRIWPRRTYKRWVLAVYERTALLND